MRSQLVRDSNVIRANTCICTCKNRQGTKCLAQESDGGDGVNAHGNSCVLDVLRDETRRQQSQVKRDGRLWL